MLHQPMRSGMTSVPSGGLAYPGVRPSLWRTELEILRSLPRKVLNRHHCEQQGGVVSLDSGGVHRGSAASSGDADPCVLLPFPSSFVCSLRGPDILRLKDE